MESNNNKVNKVRSIAPKYPKIQPAIAPKIKSTHTHTSKFNPIPNGKLSLSMKSTFNDTKQVGGGESLNTSKKWVLPPRPRPGRKPINEDEKRTKVVTAVSTTPKKKPKIKKEDEVRDKKVITNVMPECKVAAMIGKKQQVMKQEVLKSEVLKPEVLNPEVKKPEVMKEVVDWEKQKLDLKMSYLTKLKEQELIRNYIEVLTNQIKELSFVQNGVITFEALKNTTISSSSPSSSSPNTNKKIYRNDQLENINNLNDLNKFLTYSTRNSNLINSATKNNHLNDSINFQISNYVNIRNKFKLLNDQSEKVKKKHDINRKNSTLSNESNLLRSNKEFFNIDLQTATIEESPTNEPSNSYNQESFTDEHDFVNKLVLDDKEEQELGKVEIYDKQKQIPNNTLKESNQPVTKDSVTRKKLKFNCGFCTNDTPCLCFDSDLK